MPEQDKPGPVPSAPKDTNLNAADPIPGDEPTETPQGVTDAPAAPETETEVPESLHEYREVAPNVKARVSTEQEKIERQNRVAAETSAQN